MIWRSALASVLLCALLGCKTAPAPLGVVVDGEWSSDELGMVARPPEGWLLLSERDLATVAAQAVETSQIEPIFGMHDTRGAPLQRTVVAMRAHELPPSVQIPRIAEAMYERLQGVIDEIEISDATEPRTRCWNGRLLSDFSYRLRVQQQEILVHQGVTRLGDRLLTLQLAEASPREHAWLEVLAAIRLDPARHPPEPCDLF